MHSYLPIKTAQHEQSELAIAPPPERRGIERRAPIVTVVVVVVSAQGEEWREKRREISGWMIVHLSPRGPAQEWRRPPHTTQCAM